MQKKFLQVSFLLLGGFSAALFFGFLWRYFPLVAFKYDWEPTDGDVLNQTHRLLKGLPLFSGWARGDILPPYPPLFYALLATGKAFGADLVVYGRLLNLLCMVIVVCFGVLILSEKTERGFRPGPAAFLFPALFLSNYLTLEKCFYLRADALLLFIQVCIAVLLVHRPNQLRPRLLGVLMGTLLWVKQTGVGTIIGSIGSLVLRRPERRVFGLIFLSFAITFAALYAGFRACGQTYLLHGLFLNPRAVYSGSTLSLAHMEMRVVSFYSQLFWIAGLAILGLFFKKNSRLRPLVCLFLCETGISFYCLQNQGASSPYLWYHWFLICVFAAYAVEVLGSRWKLGAVLSCCGVAALTLPNQKTLLSFEALDLEQQQIVGKAHDVLIQSLVASAPTLKWISSREATSIVRQGVILDQDWCTMTTAYSRGAFSPQPLVTRLVGGEYSFAQLSKDSCGGGASQIRSAIESCFTLIRQSVVVRFGAFLPVTILQYDGAKSECKRLSERSSTH